MATTAGWCAFLLSTLQHGVVGSLVASKKSMFPAECASGIAYCVCRQFTPPCSTGWLLLTVIACLSALSQVAQKDRVKNGELYRYIADNHGIFVQPAKYEAFGLTVSPESFCVYVARVHPLKALAWCSLLDIANALGCVGETQLAVAVQVIEAMNCGLPTFATIHGGPSEIIVVHHSGSCLNMLALVAAWTLPCCPSAALLLPKVEMPCRTARAASTSTRTMGRMRPTRWRPSLRSARRRKTTGILYRRVRS